jgi:hypothetical protein
MIKSSPLKTISTLTTSWLNLSVVELVVAGRPVALSNSNLMKKTHVMLLVAAFMAATSIGYFRKTFTGTRNQTNLQAEIMAYPMKHMINRCQKDFGYTDQDMVILEKELKRFLIMTTTTSYLGMFSKDVDNLWHTFILFTKEYAEFGQRFAGKFIHHEPKISDTQTVEEQTQARREFRAFIQKYKQTFQEAPHDIWFLDSCN